MKRVFGAFEAVFDVFYLAAALAAALALIFTGQGNPARIAAGVMAAVLVCGDAFHLAPRIWVAIKGREEQMRRALGRGKQIASVSMTVFYLLLWQLGLLVYKPGNAIFLSVLVYIFAAARIIICLLPQNKWTERYPPAGMGVLRNIPFFMLGITVAGLFFLYRSALPGIGLMWLAIILSFGFYLPVALWSGKYPKLGMLMLPKTLMYLWMLYMCFSL